MATYLLWLYSIHFVSKPHLHSQYTAEFMVKLVFSTKLNEGMKRAKQCWSEF